MTRQIVWLLFCDLLLGSLTTLAQVDSRAQAVPVKLYGQHLIVVQGSIGPLEKRNLVIDTGAYPSIIDRGVARKLHLSGPEEPLDSVDHTRLRPAVLVPSVDVGPLHVTRLRGLVDDLSETSRKFGVRIDALIGLDVLGRSSFRIDYAAKKMYFGPVDPLPSSAPFELAESMICVTVRAGGRPVRLLVDTGAENLMLLGSHLPWLSARTRRTREFTNLGGSFLLREISLDSLQLGDTDFASQPIFLSDATNLPAYSFDGFLATAQFREIAFDFDRHELSWSTPRDQRRNRLRMAAASPMPLSVAVAGFAETSSVAAPASRGVRCADQEAGVVWCGTR